MTYFEQRLVRAMIGRDRPSAMDTDAYKNAMAQAGYPLRPETFYLTFRKGDGPWLNPFDLEEIVRLLRPELPDLRERGFLQSWGYGLTPAMEQALLAPLHIWSVPKGYWFGPREPLITIHSASFFVSWLEPVILMLHYAIQVATAAVNGQRRFDVTCKDEGSIVRIACEAAGITEELQIVDHPHQETRYRRRVRENAQAVCNALGDDNDRAFEVGMRAATCIGQHRIALQECKKAGIGRTSNLHLAHELNMIPVGTTGHEHQMRYGNDLVGFRAIRDSRPEPPSYLFDTDDPIGVGIPAIRQILRESPTHPCSFRFDSGDQDKQFRLLWEFASEVCPHAAYIFEDGYSAEKTETNERTLETYDFPRAQALYGYGGYLVSAPSPTDLTRDTVSAAYKLCETNGEARAKHSGTPGKESTPGRPCSLVRVVGGTGQGYTQFDRLIGQWNEDPPEGFVLLGEEPGHVGRIKPERPLRIGSSRATQNLWKEAQAEREEKITAAQED